MALPFTVDGRTAAQRGASVTSNPYPFDSAAYYEWLADWHAGKAATLRSNAPERAKLAALADQYRQRAASIRLTTTSGGI